MSERKDTCLVVTKHDAYAISVDLLKNLSTAILYCSEPMTWDEAWALKNVYRAGSPTEPIGE